MAFFTATLRRYLVDHPAILSFQWDPPRTLGSSPQFTATSIVAYLVLVGFVSPPAVPPAILRPVAAVHSLVLLALSLLMSAGAALSIAAAPSPHDAVFCLAPGTPARGPLFFWAHVAYLSKFLEFGDTLLILLSGSRHRRRLSGLHVFHHATAVVMGRVWLDTSQSLTTAVVFVNSSVHVVMYGYYFLSAVGRRPRWKRAVTSIQMLQFVIGVSMWLRTAFLHFVSSSGGCSGFWGSAFNAVFGVSLFALFLDFHAKNYYTTPTKNDKALKAT